MQPPERHEVDKGRKEDKDEHQAQVPAARFAPEEEAALLHESSRQKSEANQLFGSAQYSQAIGEYDKALSSCPTYLEYEIAVLKSNISACHLKLEDWKAAVDSATAALDALDRLTPTKPEEEQNSGGADHAVVEIEGEGLQAEREQADLEMTDQRREDVRRIKAKALMRRARARSEQGGWGNLQGAEEGIDLLSDHVAGGLLSRCAVDYNRLAHMPNLPAQDDKIVQRALSSLPSRINAAKEKEMGEMMGKLKELGNGILKPFGLSTNNFNMVKDEATGGYSMNFNQGS